MSLKEIAFNFFRSLGLNVSRVRTPPSLTNVNSDVTLLDVGSSGGLAPQWEAYYKDKRFNVILVEPDKPAADELSKMYPQATIIPYALGSSEQAAKLNITQNPACSSILTPDYDVLRKFPVIKWFEVTDHIDVRLTPYATVAKEMSLKTPDFVKLDVQGFESEVLRGFGPVLNDVLCIELETHIKPIYKGQKILPEITEQLEASGFFLRHLATVGIFEDEVVEFNAFFIRRPELIRTETDRKKVRFWCDLHQFPNGAYFADWDKQR